MKLTEKQIARLESKGFKRWTKGDYDRLYLDASYFCTVNMAEASRKIRMTVNDSKSYIDVKTGEIFTTFDETYYPASRKAFFDYCIEALNDNEDHTVFEGDVKESDMTKEKFLEITQEPELLEKLDTMKDEFEIIQGYWDGWDESEKEEMEKCYIRMKDKAFYVGDFYYKKKKVGTYYISYLGANGYSADPETREDYLNLKINKPGY